MRLRVVKPELYGDKKVCQVKVIARYLFVGLLNHCDDQGRCEDDAHMIRLAVFPRDDMVDADVDVLLQELAAVREADEPFGLIQRYQVERKRYICIPNFLKHQTINHPSKPKYPPPPGESVETPGIVPEASGSATRGLPPKLNQTKLNQVKTKKATGRPASAKTDKNPEKKGMLPGVPQIGKPKRGQRRATSPATQAKTARKRHGLLKNASRLYTADGMETLQQVAAQAVTPAVLTAMDKAIQKDHRAFARILWHSNCVANPIGFMTKALKSGLKYAPSDDAMRWADEVLLEGGKAAARIG